MTTMAESCRRKSGECTSRILAAVAIAVLFLSLMGCLTTQNYSVAKIGANETSAIQSLRTIAQAELMYFNTRRSFATLQQLSADQLILAELAAGERSGYRFAIRITESSASGGPAYEATAVRVNYGSTGKRSLYLNEEG